MIESARAGWPTASAASSKNAEAMPCRRPPAGGRRAARQGRRGMTIGLGVGKATLAYRPESPDIQARPGAGVRDKSPARRADDASAGVAKACGDAIDRQV